MSHCVIHLIYVHTYSTKYIFISSASHNLQHKCLAQPASFISAWMYDHISALAHTATVKYLLGLYSTYGHIGARAHGATIKHLPSDYNTSPKGEKVHEADRRRIVGPRRPNATQHPTRSPFA